MILKDKFKNWLPVIIFITIAIWFRLYRNSVDNYYLLAGSDGPYLPVQVKSLFEHYRLAFPDMPLLFILCTLIAKVLFFLKLGAANECILMAIRVVDTFLPPLAAIPVFFISKELSSDQLKSKLSNYFLIAFSILNITPLFIFSFQLQKNSFATILIFSYIYYVVKILKYNHREDFIKIAITFFICLITHFGSSGFLIFITSIILLFWFLFQKKRTVSIKFLIVIVAFLTITASIIALLDYSRFIRIINVPLKIFEAPVLLFAIYGQNFILKGYNLLVIISMNFLAIVGFIFLIKQRKQLETYKLILGLALGTSIIFLSNPMLGLEWASRLYMLAYIPTTILYLILYNSTSNKWFKISTIIVFAWLLIESFGVSAFEKVYMTIDDASFLELQQIKEKKIFSANDVIVARQSLRILSNWVIESKGIDRYLLTKDEFNKYPNCYLLKQIKGKNPLSRGSEPNVGDSILQVYKGEHFEVYKLTSNIQLPDNAEKIFKGIRGTIHSISGNNLYVIDNKINKIRHVIYDPFNALFPKLSVGMKVEINGEWTPFSLTIKAETIKQIDNFEDK